MNGQWRGVWLCMHEKWLDWTAEMRETGEHMGVTCRTEGCSELVLLAVKTRLP